tara:strand:- start:2682 stop:3257 length:576 start_codon:yes stop_codon:yes gene_type:complete
MGKLERAISIIDDENRKDPNFEFLDNEKYPKEFLYSKRMSERLDIFAPESSDIMKIAVRGHHISRWEIPRNEFSNDRKGYLQWRIKLYSFHADKVSAILKVVGYKEDFINRVSSIIKKHKLKKDPETQLLEDIICLVFLEHYFVDFARKHEEEKVIDIVKKTLVKMSEQGKKAAMEIELPEFTLSFLEKAL